MASSTVTWRIFCAIELPGTIRALVLRHISSLQQALPAARASWARESTLHLTLKFLGEIPVTSVPNFSKVVERAVAGVTPFGIQLNETGAFPKHGRPEVLWIGIDDSSRKLSALQTRLEEESQAAGFPKEERPFHPHLTIARLRDSRDAQALATAHKRMGFEPVEICVSELLVIRSELSSAGSKYTVVSQHVLH
ncbi:MAG TPA: RNA 2',3'-cyclic phosphodiesterase [Pyrinomonadaceae bacterium]|jgi:2'-5' RNA ligase